MPGTLEQADGERRRNLRAECTSRGVIEQSDKIRRAESAPAPKTSTRCARRLVEGRATAWSRVSRVSARVSVGGRGTSLGIYQDTRKPRARARAQQPGKTARKKQRDSACSRHRRMGQVEWGDDERRATRKSARTCRRDSQADRQEYECWHEGDKGESQKVERRARGSSRRAGVQRHEAEKVESQGLHAIEGEAPTALVSDPEQGVLISAGPATTRRARTRSRLVEHHHEYD